MDGPVHTEKQVPSAEDVARLQEEVKSLDSELKLLESRIELRQDMAKLLSDSTKEKLTKLHSKKRKRDGAGDDRAVKSRRSEDAPFEPEKPLCSRPLVVNKAGTVRTVRRVRMVEPQPLLPAPIWSRRSVAKKKVENVCLVEFSLKVLRDLMAHQWGWPFLKPVDPVALNLPDYFTIIKKPIDLGTIKNNVLEINYTLFKDFVEDVRLVWKNCMIYNSPTMDIHAMAQSLHNLFEEKIKPFTKFIDNDTPLYSKKYLAAQVSGLSQTQTKLQQQLQGLNKKPLASSGVAAQEIQIPPVRPKEEIEKKITERMVTLGQTGEAIPVSEELLTGITGEVADLELKYMKGLQSILQEDPHGATVFAALTTTTTPVSVDVDQLQPITLYRIETYLEDCTVDRIKHAPLVKPKTPSKPVRKETSMKSTKRPTRPSAPSKTSMSHARPPRPPPKRVSSSESSDFSSISDEEISDEELARPPARPPVRPPPPAEKPIEKKPPPKKVGIRVTGLGGSNTPKPKPTPAKPPAKPATKAGSKTPSRAKPASLNANRPSTPKPATASSTEKPASTSAGTDTTKAAGSSTSAAKWLPFEGEGGEGEEETPGGAIRKSTTQPKAPAQPKSPQPVISHHNIQQRKSNQPQPSSQMQAPNGPMTPEMAFGMGMGMMPGMMPNMMMPMGMGMPGMMPMGMGMPGMMPMGMMPGMMPMGMGMGMGMGFPATPSSAPPGFVRSAPPPPTIRSAPPPTTSTAPAKANDTTTAASTTNNKTDSNTTQNKEANTTNENTDGSVQTT